jgi:hypothetical protein
MLLAKDHEVIKTFVFQCLHEPFRVSVQVWTSYRQATSVSVLRPNNRIEHIREFVVSVANEMGNGHILLIQFNTKVSGLLLNPLGIGMSGRIRDKYLP